MPERADVNIALFQRRKMKAYELRLVDHRRKDQLWTAQTLVEGSSK